jgi:hypothetical protein
MDTINKEVGDFTAPTWILPKNKKTPKVKTSEVSRFLGAIEDNRILLSVGVGNLRTDNKKTKFVRISNEEPKSPQVNYFNNLPEVFISE